MMEKLIVRNAATTHLWEWTKSLLRFHTEAERTVYELCFKKQDSVRGSFYSDQLNLIWQI
jgi:hypothetical protein